MAFFKQLTKPSGHYSAGRVDLPSGTRLVLNREPGHGTKSNPVYCFALFLPFVNFCGFCHFFFFFQTILLRRIGGPNLQHSIWNMLHAIMTDDVAVQINMSGAHGKFSFRRTRLLSVISGAFLLFSQVEMCSTVMGYTWHFFVFFRVFLNTNV